MTITKAIEIIKELPDILNNILDYDQEDALKLGIQALEAILSAREGNYASFKRPLPGETKG